MLPTLADICEIPCETNKPLDGISVKQSLVEEDSQWDDRYLLNYWRGRMSIRSQKYRLGPG